MYNKVKLLVEIGKLEVRFEEDSQVITELSNFRDKICSDDILQGAIAFGRLQARIGETTEEIQTINCILTNTKPVPDMSIGELEFTVRTYNVLDRNQLRTVKQITEMSSEGWTKIKNLGRKSYEEIAEKMHGLGLEIASYGESTEVC